MYITREQARQIFMAGAMWEQGATDQNFNDTWDVLSRKMSKTKSKESDSLPCVSRFLTQGEQIHKDDEFLNEKGEWESTECAGDIYDEGDHYQHRRLNR